MDYSTTEGREYFYRSGEEFVDKTFENVKVRLPARQRALEIGCGIGRLTFPYSAQFEEVYAVDISETMLRKLREEADKRQIRNIKTFQAKEKWDTPGYFDYAYSFLVFQHIEDFKEIENYIAMTADSLKLGGFALFHFDTRSSNILYRIRNITPDFFLPWNYRKGIRRIRRNANRLRAVFEKNGLKVTEEYRPNSEHHTYLLVKA